MAAVKNGSTSLDGMDDSIGPRSFQNRIDETRLLIFMKARRDILVPGSRSPNLIYPPLSMPPWCTNILEPS
jgi:hypothetical protein